MLFRSITPINQWRIQFWIVFKLCKMMYFDLIYKQSLLKDKDGWIAFEIKVKVFKEIFWYAYEEAILPKIFRPIESLKEKGWFGDKNNNLWSSLHILRQPWHFVAYKLWRWISNKNRKFAKNIILINCRRITFHTEYLEYLNFLILDY